MYQPGWEGIWGRMDTRICMTESLRCSPGTTTVLLISYSVVQLPSHVRLFVTPWTAACQASLSLTISRSLPSSCPLHWWWHPAISSSHVLFSFCPQSFPASGTFPMSQLFASNDQNTGVSASVSVLPMNIQGWSPLRFTGFISLLSKGLQEPSPAPQFQGINSLALCLLYGPALTTAWEHWEHHSLDYMDLCQQSNVSAFQHKIKSWKFKKKHKRSALVYRKGYHGDFPGGPVVKILPSSTEGAGLIPDWEDKIHMPPGQKKTKT